MAMEMAVDVAFDEKSGGRRKKKEGGGGGSSANGAGSAGPGHAAPPIELVEDPWRVCHLQASPEPIAAPENTAPFNI